MATTSRRRWLRFSLRSSLIAIAVFAVIMACIGNLLRIHYAEQQVALEITNAGGYVVHSLFGLASPDHDSRRWEDGPEWLHRVVVVRLSGTDIDDERLARLDLQRFEHLRSLIIGYDAVYGADGPKWEHFPAPITDRGLAELPPFPKLQHLHLWDLPVGDAGLHGLARKYPRLEAVSLRGTRVADLTMAELGQLGGLKGLDLQGTLVTDSGLAHLATVKDLQTLDLSETRIVGTGLKDLSGLPKLWALDLRDTDVNDDNAHHLSRLQQLHRLYLSGTNIGDGGVSHLTSLQELTFLGLDDTAVTDAGVEYLVQLPRLDSVSLTGTVVTDAGLVGLAKMPNMRRVYLDGTDVTMIGVEDFLRREPDRTVCYNTQIFHVEDLPCEE